jgi:streptomycin 6-kinase
MTLHPGDQPVAVPAELAALHARYDGDAGRAWVAALPELAAELLDRWRLRLDGPPGHGQASLVLPVRGTDGTPAALKLQPVNEENATEAVGLRTWDGHGAVRLLADDPATGALLLERLDASRPLSSVADDGRALQILAELLARLVASPAPAGLRRLADVAREMVDRTPTALTALQRPEERQLVATCAAAVRELLPEAGDRLLHWDLHYDNILAADREPWLAIDPKPLAGDPGFELLPALHNRWPDIVATGDVTRAVRRRFDLMVDVLGLDRQRALGWTLGRILQNALWDVDDGETRVDATQVAIAEALLSRPRESAGRSLPLRRW